MAAPLLARPAGADDAGTIHVVGPPNDGYKAVYYAIKAGIFRKYEVSVDAAIVNNGQAAAAALIGGSADVAYTNMLALIQAHLRGVPIQAISAASWYLTERPNAVMLVLKDSPLHSARDLNGKVLGAPSLGDINSAATMAWLDQNGADVKSIHLVEVPPSSGVPFLEEGRLAALTINEPLLSQAIATGKVRVLGQPLDAIAKRFESSAFAVMAPAVGQRFDVMTRFARAMHESQVFTNTHPDETVELVAAYSGATPETVAHSRRTTDPEYVDVRNLQPLIDVLAKYGVIDKAFPARDLISPAALKPPA